MKDVACEAVKYFSESVESVPEDDSEGGLAGMRSPSLDVGS